MTNWLIESRTELRDLIAQAKRHERAGMERTQHAIRQAEEFLPRYVRYTNEDCDVAQALVSAMTAPLSRDEAASMQTWRRILSNGRAVPTEEFAAEFLILGGQGMRSVHGPYAADDSRFGAVIRTFGMSERDMNEAAEVA